ncbi:MAG TPA: hypothetical protein GXZ45_07825 [Propionibacterium sp.]|nr:hypothetical protein [Propionibacterium sp.]
MRKQLALATATALASTAALVGLAVDASAAEHKVWVCKYVGKPGEDEVLKPGKNPIQVSYNATDADAPQVGAWFNDGQGRSVVVALGTDPEPDASVCTTPPVVDDEDEVTPEPTPEPTPTADPSVTPEPSATPTPSESPRGVPAETGGESDYTGLAVLGGLGAAGIVASAGALVASRRRH